MGASLDSGMQGVIEMPDDLQSVYMGTPPKRVGEKPADMVKVGVKMEPITRAQWTARRDALKADLDRLEKFPPGCMTCLFLDASKVCLKYEARPPQDFYATGCDDWQFDEIPF